MDAPRYVVVVVAEESDLPCSVLEPFTPISDQATPERPEEMNPAIACGMALSGNSYSQNFLFTFADKIRKLQENRVNQIIIPLYRSRADRLPKLARAIK